MAGLVPAIHVFLVAAPEDVDARDKRGHDGFEDACVPYAILRLACRIISTKRVKR